MEFQEKAATTELINLVSRDPFKKQGLSIFNKKSLKRPRRLQNLSEIEEVSDIEEESEGSSSSSADEEVASIVKPPKLRRATIKLRRPEYRKQRKAIQESQDIFNFITALKAHKRAYDSFVKEAVRRDILDPPQLQSSDYYNKYILGKPKSKTPPLIKSFTDKRPSFTRKALTPVHQTTQILPKSLVYIQPKLTEGLLQKFNELNAPASKLLNSKITRSRKSLLSVSSSKIWNYGQRKHFIDRTNPRIQKIFMKICKGTTLSRCRLDSTLFYDFLVLRYPEHIASTLCKHLVFNSASFDDYVEEMERLLKTGDEYHLQICFEAYDFNKDKFICYQDTYAALSQRKENTSDSDLVKIERMFELKKRGEAPKPRFLRYREKSIATFCFDESGKEADNKLKQVLPTEHPSKKEALILEEFCLIDFEYKPGLIKDFYEYTCNFNILKVMGLAHTPDDISSEMGDYVMKNYNAGGFLSEIKETSYKYFFELVTHK